MDTWRSNAGHCSSSVQFVNMDENRNFKFGVPQNPNQFSNDTTYTSTQGHSQYRNDMVYTFTGGSNKNSQFGDFQRRVLDKMKRKTSFVRQMCDRSRAIFGKCYQNLRVPTCKWNPIVLNCKQEPVVEAVSGTEIASIKRNDENLGVHNTVVIKVEEISEESLESDANNTDVRKNEEIHEKTESDANNNVVIKDEEISENSLESDVVNNVIITKDEEISVKTLESDAYHNVVIKDEEITEKTLESDTNNSFGIKDEDISEKSLGSDKRTIELDSNFNIITEGKGKEKVAEYGDAESGLKERKAVDERHSADAHSKDYIEVAGLQEVVLCLQCKCHVARLIFPLHLKGRRHRQMVEENEKAEKIDKVAGKPSDKEGEVTGSKAGPLIKGIKAQTMDIPVRHYTRERLLELQSVPASRCIPDSLKKDLIVVGIWDAGKFNAFHHSYKWKTFPRKRPADLLRDILLEQEQPGKRRKLEEDNRFSVEGEVFTRKQPFIKRKEETVKSPVRQYTREELIELQNAAASRCIPAGLEKDFKDFIVNGIWDAGKFNAYHKGELVSWNIKHSKKIPAELLRDILQEEGILGDVPTRKQPFIKRTEKNEETVKSPVRQYTREELLELQNAAASRCIPPSLEKDFKEFIVNGIWDAGKFNAFHKGELVSWNIKHSKKRPAELLRDILQEEGILGKRRKVEGNNSKSTSYVQEHRKKKKNGWQKSKSNARNFHFELPSSKYPIPSFEPQKLPVDSSASNSVYTFVGDIKTEVGDIKAEVGDMKVEVGDMKAEVGDTKAEVGDMKAEVGDVKAVEDNKKQPGSEEKCIRNITKAAETIPNEEVIVIDTDEDENENDRKQKKDLDVPEVIVIDSGDSTETESQGPLDRTVKTIYCSVCKSHVDSENWPRHMRGNRHRLKRKVIKLYRDKKKMESRQKQNIFKVCIDQLRKEADKRKQEYRTKRETACSNRPELKENEKRMSRRSSSEKENVERHKHKLSKEEKGRVKHTQKRSAKRKTNEKDRKTHHKKASTPVLNQSGEGKVKQKLTYVEDDKVSNVVYPDTKNVHPVEKTTETTMDFNNLVLVKNSEDDNGCFSDQWNGAMAVQESDEHPLLIATPYMSVPVSELNPPNIENTGSETPTSTFTNDKSVTNQHVSTLDKKASYVIHKEELSENNNIESTSFDSSSTAVLKENLSNKDCAVVFPLDVNGNTQMLQLHHNIPCKLAVKIEIPEKKYPWINISKRLHDPSCNILQQIQQESGCRIQLKGIKSDILNRNDALYSRIYEDLHILVESYAQADIAFERLAVAIKKIKEFMDKITQDTIDTMEIQMHQQAVEYNPQNYISIGSIGMDYRRDHLL